MEGKLIGRSWTQERSILLLSSERILFSAVLPPGAFQREEELASRWPDGSTVTVTGVFSGNVDRRAITRREGVSQLESFQILLRSPEDVTVVAAPTWWNSRHTLMVIGSMAVLTLGILCWVVVLRHQVHQQTRIIRADEEKFRYLAQHDPLTGLFVRTVLLERLEQEIHEAALNTSSLALLMVDVDGFKQLNDSMGHAAGDEVLVSLAGRIQRSVRESDTVARMGGDEFMALLPKMHGIQDAERVAAQLVRSISVPFIVGGNTVAISVSVGVTAYPEGGTDSKSLIHCADAALYRAKALGRNRYQLFGEDNHPKPDPFEPRTRLQ
jgi:diguanylate cyclase (GGDEF)-like protein